MTSAKRITTNSNYTFGNYNTSERCTMSKSVIPNTCNTIRNKNVDERCTMALVGEAITLAMRTSVPWHNKTNENK